MVYGTAYSTPKLSGYLLVGFVVAASVLAADVDKLLPLAKCTERVHEQRDNDNMYRHAWIRSVLQVGGMKGFTRVFIQAAVSGTCTSAHQRATMCLHNALAPYRCTLILHTDIELCGISVWNSIVQ